MSTEDMLDRAEKAQDFVNTDYWIFVSDMLKGTINSEFEEMLANDSHLSLNRASVAVARKVLRMPYIDIEQGKAAVKAVETHQAAYRGKLGKSQGE